MKIIRDGKEYELTTEELLNAYYEQRDVFDREDILNVMECNEYELTDDEKKKVLVEYQDAMSDDDTYWMTIDNTIRKVIRERVKEK